MRVITLLFASICMARGETIEVSAGVTHDPVDFWYEITHSTDTGTTHNASWAAGVAPLPESFRIPFTLKIPPLVLPPRAVVTSTSVAWGGSWPEFENPHVPQEHTMLVAPIQADCDGTPCAFAPTLLHGLGLYATTQFPVVVDVESLKAGYELTGFWELGFGELSPSLTEPGFNAVTTHRWSATFAPYITVDADVVYTVAAVPEPAAFIPCAAGLVGLLAMRRWSGVAGRA